MNVPPVGSVEMSVVVGTKVTVAPDDRAFQGSVHSRNIGILKLTKRAGGGIGSARCRHGGCARISIW